MTKITEIQTCCDCLKTVQSYEISEVHDKHGLRFVCKQCKSFLDKVENILKKTL